MHTASSAVEAGFVGLRSRVRWLMNPSALKKYVCYPSALKKYVCFMEKYTKRESSTNIYNISNIN